MDKDVKIDDLETSISKYKHKQFVGKGRGSLRMYEAIGLTLGGVGFGAFGLALLAKELDNGAYFAFATAVSISIVVVIYNIIKWYNSRHNLTDKLTKPRGRGALR